MDNAVGAKLSNWTGRHERPMSSVALSCQCETRARRRWLRWGTSRRSGAGRSSRSCAAPRGSRRASTRATARACRGRSSREGPHRRWRIWSRGASRRGSRAMDRRSPRRWRRGPTGASSRWRPRTPGVPTGNPARGRGGSANAPRRSRRHHPRAAAAAAVRTPSERGSTTATARADPSARAASASAPPGRSTPSPRRPTPTRHPSRSPRRRSQLCCEIRSTARRRWTRCSRPSRCTPPRSSDRARASRKGWTTPPTRDASCARAPAASPRAWTHGCAGESTRGALRARCGRWRRWRRFEGKPASGNASATPRRGRSSGRCRRGLS